MPYDIDTKRVPYDIDTNLVPYDTDMSRVPYRVPHSDAFHVMRNSGDDGLKRPLDVFPTLRKCKHREVLVCEQSVWKFGLSQRALLDIRRHGSGGSGCGSFHLGSAAVVVSRLTGMQLREKLGC